ncbi:hypothetical protein GOP47_0012254 [Adiantum capillus-veneris]|uniref:Histone H2A n=1 Tax=Adiantum capillus-veneris TaxID=13818 RepID=A0A9D4UQC2_ADICA|nr:hypothetical protein GOP47_0012254 [Adiantum capillus-veneris]
MESAREYAAAGGGGGRGKAKVTIRRSQSQRAGLLFPVGRLARHLRHGNYAPRIGWGAPLFLAGALQYLASEVLYLAGNVAQANGKHKISNRHIHLAIGCDAELSKLLSHVIIPSAGVVPFLHPSLLPQPKPNSNNCPHHTCTSTVTNPFDIPSLFPEERRQGPDSLTL